jgi:apolipoprotein N-acyltransferase
VQPRVAVTEKFDRARHPEIWDRLVALTEEVAPRVDVVVWPESSRPRAVHWDADGPFRDPAMEDLARRVGTPILYGCEIARFRGETFEALYNGAAIAYPDGRAGDWYGKQRLLPFAEGVPFAALFDWNPIAAGKSGGGGVLTMLGKFSPGPRATLFEVAGVKLGVLICYEGMYPQLSARYRRDGADALAVLTNDMWWGRTAFPEWHANQAASVARTMQVPVLRAANAGISGAYAPDGTPVAETELLAATAVVVEVPRASGGVPWAAWIGPAVPWAAFVALALVALAARARRSRRSS